MDKPTAALVKLAHENPWRYFTFQEIADIFGFGKNIPGALANEGAPVVARKMNPAALGRWIEGNREKLNEALR